MDEVRPPRAVSRPAALTPPQNLSRAVAETFCRLHEDGVIYRANRLVNWCVRLNTTLSNLEVCAAPRSAPRSPAARTGGPEEARGPHAHARPRLRPQGKVRVRRHHRVCVPHRWLGCAVLSVRPPPPLTARPDERIVVATTRPETMLGDTAVAVHPDDPRYKHLHGRFVRHPFLPDRRMPIITDAVVVDMAFGTGAVKITPAHDPNDYDVGVRHALEFVNILNDDGTFNACAGPRFEVRARAACCASREADGAPGREALPCASAGRAGAQGARAVCRHEGQPHDGAHMRVSALPRAGAAT